MEFNNDEVGELFLGDQEYSQKMKLEPHATNLKKNFFWQFRTGNGFLHIEKSIAVAKN